MCDLIKDCEHTYGIVCTEVRRERTRGWYKENFDVEFCNVDIDRYDESRSFSRIVDTIGKFDDFVFLDDGEEPESDCS